MLWHVDAVPEPPLARHVWAWSAWPPRGDPAPGVVVGWHLAPDRSYQSPWQVQIAVQRAPGSVAVVWMPAQRLTPVRDHSPGRPRRGVRHVWISANALPPSPALLIDWRRGTDGWEAFTASVTDTSLLLSWHPACDITPVRDDSWSIPEVTQLKRG